MSDRPDVLLTASAAIYGLAALPLLLAPDETLAFAAAEATPLARTLLELIAAALFGYAMLAWMNRYSRVGGIFGRPIVIANFAFTMIAALTLGRLLARGAPTWPLLLSFAAAAALAVAFGAKLFGRPTSRAGGNG